MSVGKGSFKFEYNIGPILVTFQIEFLLGSDLNLFHIQILFCEFQIFFSLSDLIFSVSVVALI